MLDHRVSDSVQIEANMDSKTMNVAPSTGVRLKNENLKAINSASPSLHKLG